MAITCLDISRDGTMAVTGNEQLSISGVGVDRGVIELRGVCLRELGQLQYFPVPFCKNVIYVMKISHPVSRFD